MSSLKFHEKSLFKLEYFLGDFLKYFLQHLVRDLNTFVTPGVLTGYNKSMIYLFIHFIVLSRANKGITNGVYFPRCELYNGVEEVPQLCFISHAAVQFSREAVLPYGFEIVVVFLYPSLTFFRFPVLDTEKQKCFQNSQERLRSHKHCHSVLHHL